MRRTLPLVALLAWQALAAPVQAQSWGEIGNNLLKELGGSTASEPRASALASDEVVAGLREALARGSEIAVSELGREDGFLARPEVRIPLPDALESIGSGMRRFGLGGYVDEFETSMNRAAEQAVPEALDLFHETVRTMTIEDAMGILEGPDDAATQYFRRHNEARLEARFLPIVREATSRAGVTGAYKGMLAQAGMAAQLFDPESLDLDRYVTDEAIDGLFLMLAREERRIREDPVARSSELLQRVFGGR